MNIPAFHCTQRKFMLPVKLNTTRHHNQWRHCNYLPKLTCVSALLCNPYTGALKTQTSELPNLENSDPKTTPPPDKSGKLSPRKLRPPQIWKILTPRPPQKMSNLHPQTAINAPNLLFCEKCKQMKHFSFSYCTWIITLYASYKFNAKKALKHTYQLRRRANTVRMHTNISPGQWQKWIAVLLFLGLISMA